MLYLFIFLGFVLGLVVAFFILCLIGAMDQAPPGFERWLK